MRVLVGERHISIPECFWSVHKRHPGSVGSQIRYPQRGSTRLDLTCSGDLNFLRARMENCEVPDCALVMREGEEYGDVDERRCRDG